SLLEGQRVQGLQIHQLQGQCFCQSGQMDVVAGLGQCCLSLCSAMSVPMSCGYQESLPSLLGYFLSHACFSVGRDCGLGRIHSSFSGVADCRHRLAVAVRPSALPENVCRLMALRSKMMSDWNNRFGSLC